MYLPGLVPSELADSVSITDAFLALVSASAAAMFNALVAYPVTPIVLSLFNAGHARSAGVGAPITYLTFDKNLDSQRRRLAGRGA
jgi:hypothetical protein